MKWAVVRFPGPLPHSPSFCPALHLVRHGQSTWNLQRRVQGQQPGPVLTDLGRRQAATAAAALSGTRAARLLTSDLTRAVQTAEIIGRVIGLTATPTPLLREQALGSLEGLTTRQATAELTGVDLTDPGARFGGGESRNDVLARIRALLASGLITDQPSADEIVVVTHGDTMRYAIAHLLGEDPAEAPWRPIENGAVFTIQPDANSGGCAIDIR